MDDARTARLVVELASLAGRSLDETEAEVVVRLSRSMSDDQANAVWRRLRDSPATVSLRDYLAMTLRFVERDPPERSDSPP